MRKAGAWGLAGTVALLGCAAVASASSPTSSPAAANEFAKAEKLSAQLPITVDGTNKGFTKKPGEPNAAGVAGGASAWYSWTPASTGDVVAETCGSKLNTVLGIYTGTNPGSLTEVTSDNDACGTQSKVRFTAEKGTRLNSRNVRISHAVL